MTRQQSLEQLRAVLGRWRSVRVNESSEQGVVVSWDCGCRALGREFASLTVEPCDQHAAELLAQNDQTQSSP